MSGLHRPCPVDEAPCVSAPPHVAPRPASGRAGGSGGHVRGLESVCRRPGCWSCWARWPALGVQCKPWPDACILHGPAGSWASAAGAALAPPVLQAALDDDAGLEELAASTVSAAREPQGGKARFRAPSPSGHPAFSFPLAPSQVWKLGWSPKPGGDFGTVFPEIPVEFLQEKEVFKEFIYRINTLGRPGARAAVGSAFFYSREELRQDTIACMCSVIYTKLSR